MNTFDNNQHLLQNVKHDEVNSSNNDIEIIDPQDCENDYDPIPYNIRVLWNKRDYFYELDGITRENIIKTFELKIKGEKNIKSEDAFYGRLSVVPLEDINVISDDTYIKERLVCRRLRQINIDLINFSKKILLEKEDCIDLYLKCEDNWTKTVLKSIIIRKAQIDILLYKVRNYISEIILNGEECYAFLEEAINIVNKNRFEIEFDSLSKK